MNDSPSTFRLFLAMYPPPDAAAAMSELIAGVSRARARRMPVDQIHMTVLFLGDRPEAQVERIKLETRTLAAGTGPVLLTPQRIITMPERPPPRLIALETAVTPNLHGLYRRLSAALGRAEDNNRPTLLPHFTLCRFRRGAPAKPMHAPAKLPPFECTELRLMRSTLSSEGAEHTSLAAIPLAVTQ
jgi:2'-5' RNA ligase